MAIKIPKIWLIIVIALLLRSWQIAKLPSLNPDEAALGYNAYSLLQTGKDEHGLSWPLHFQSFGDYKPGGYVYLDLPFIKVLGLTPLAVRLPNLIFSVLTIYVLYRLVLLLTLDFKLSLFSAFVLAISPWHLQFSRGAWESSTALFFLLLGIYWLYRYLINQQKIFIYLFPLPLVIALATYHSARIIAPLLLLSIIIFNFKKLFNYQFLIAALIGILLVSPVAFSFLKNGGMTRFGGVGLTADKGPIARSEELLNQHGNTKIFNRIIHNKRVLYALSWVEKYSSHFNLNFLFINGDEVPRSKNPDMGQLYLLELPFLILGIVKLIQSKNKHLQQFTFAFLFISPLASSLTFQAPSALRALPMVIPLSILVALGLNQIISNFSFTIKLLIFLSYLLSILYYLDSYYIHAPKRYSFAWNSGFSEIIPYVESQKNNYQNIYFTNKYDQPYILYLFFSHYPPQLAQLQTKLTPPDQFGFSTVLQIDNIHFEIPKVIPPKSLIIDAADFESSGQSFKIYTN
ncbi:MAG: glycosyltransferase family 39 protein [Candidatus Shapirobacteria bacterium]|jgi:4-amino-4-deoxy-L-arabinose transferase-like glycosyltransferase